MTRSDLLARLERMEQEARADAAGAGAIAWRHANNPLLANTAGAVVATQAARYALDALALAEARAALEIQNVWIVIQDCEVPGAQPGIRGVFPSQADAEAEIAAIRAEHPDLDRGDFCVQVERIRPPLPAPPSEDPS